MTGRPHHRPLAPGDGFFASLPGGQDPARLTEAAARAATVLVRGARAAGEQEIAERVVHLAENEGMETLAELWSASPSASLGGCLWRLFLLRSSVQADPVGIAREYDAGRGRAEVAGVVAGVADPPGPDEVQTMADQVLAGIAAGDFADVLLRAAAFARVLATGRAVLAEKPAEQAARLLVVADQLDQAAHLELEGGLQ
ncbi:MAG: hypothetical protein ACR2K3_10685 [Nocardioides sp.]